MKTIAFVITSKCGEKCAYCFVKKQPDTSLARFKKLLSLALEKNPKIKKVVVTGGDPELNKDFWGICREVKSRGLLLKVHSNYSNREALPHFFGLIDEVSIPIDSIRAAPFRSQGNSKNSFDALNFFLGKIKIQVHTVVSKENLADLDDIRQFLNSKGFFEKNSWKLFRLTGVKKLQGSILDDKEWDAVKEKYSDRKVHFVDDVLNY